MVHRRIPIVLATGTAAALLCAAPAQAAQVGSIIGSAQEGYTYAGTGSERNELRVTFSGNSMTFTELDFANTITHPGGDCNGASPDNPVACTTGTVNLAVGEGDDYVQVPNPPPLAVSVDGGPGADTLLTPAGAQTLAGGADDDYLNAGADADSYLGGPGDDLIAAADGAVDRIDCGDGLDAVSADPDDVLTGCEAVLDDADGDGSPTFLDCNDRNPAIGPGAPEVAGNGIDEDCDGSDLAAARITSGVRSAWRAFPSFTRNVRLVVRDLPAGATVRVTCSRKRRPKGSGCGFKRRTFKTEPGARSSLVLTKVLKKRRLRARTVVEVRITAPRMIGKVLRYRMRRGQAPAIVTLCLRPGSPRPRNCA